jgi:transposase
MAYKIGISREQLHPFPLTLEASIGETNIVRVIDIFVDSLDLVTLGFQHSIDNERGTSMYHPGALLKLYIYGYFNRIRSSRRLEVECERNIELHWLLNRLMPKYHTIADFRKIHPEALNATFKEFTQFCIILNLIGKEKVAFDGTKIHAQNNPSNNFNAARLEKLLARINTKTAIYEQYLADLDAADSLEQAAIVTIPSIAVTKSKNDIENALVILAERKIKYEAFQTELKTRVDADCDESELQISTVDPDARSMIFKHNNTAIGYNVQTAADAEHCLIVHYEVTNVGDTNALSSLAKDTKKVLNLGENDTYDGLADAGYHTGSQLAECIANGIMTYVCPQDVAAAQATLSNETTDKDNFSKDKFIYDQTTDTYTCPNAKQLTTNGTTYTHKARNKRGKARNYKQYTLPCKTCQDCPFSDQCQGSRKKQSHGRIIERYEFDDAIESNRKRLIQRPKTYQERKEIIEHPFGTIKRSWGYYYTLLRTKRKVSGEFALIYLCYNLRRVINILGVNELKNAIKAYYSIKNNSYEALCSFFRKIWNLAIKKKTIKSGFFSNLWAIYRN